MKVANKKCIRTLSFQHMRASKLKSVVSIAAIALTTVLFTALFTIVMSLVYAMEQSNFRQVGGYSHGGFKYLTYEQVQELKDDPLIQEYGVRHVLGMPTGEPFAKSHVEVSYCDENEARMMFCEPIEGRLPREGTNEAATDTKVLSLLGVEPRLGEEFTITVAEDGQEVTATFTLCGYWEYDDAIVANHILIPESRVRELVSRFDRSGIADNVFDTYSLDVMFRNARHIEENLNTILERHGYQSESPSEENFISYGVNWGYMNAQLDRNLDLMTVLAVIGILLIIIFTGYLIIYNVFQISVANDIRFYGMLKTIGTTGRQIRKILYIQALSLSVIGIPVGLVLGYALGAVLTPRIMAEFNGFQMGTLSVSPLIFLFAAAFALVTTMISCRRPAKRAAKVSPIEALRYTEGDNIKRTVKRSKKGSTIPAFAWANLGRSRSKTAVTVVSLSLAVVLFTITVTFANGFDMDKYIARFVSADYLVAQAGHLTTNGIFWSGDIAVDEAVIARIDAMDGIADSGRTYGLCSSAGEFVTEEWYRSLYGSFSVTQEELDLLAGQADSEDGLILNKVQLYGMEPFCLGKLDVLDGDLSKLYQGGNYVAAVYYTDDYGNPEADTHWAQVGDKVKLRYTDESGSYRDEEYEVAALVAVPQPLSYRYRTTADEFVMGAETFCEATGTSAAIYYAFDMDKESLSYTQNMEAVEQFLSDFTQNTNTDYSYESRKTYAAEFESLRNMFTIVGGALSFIVGLVGVLNFVNAILTGITTRKREFAVLQAVGMTGRQLKQMLVTEGLYESLGAVIAALVLTLLTAPLMRVLLNGMFWFFTYRLTVSPILILAPVFALLGVLVPYFAYKVMVKKSVVERLREAE